jgi:sugar phosphate isomerase/epimerase
MKLGFLTVCLGNMPLEKKAEWARENGFESLEIACWPESNDRDYSASDIDVVNLTQKKADEINRMMKDNGLVISSLAYYDNNMDRDPDRRKAINNHLLKVIDAAAMLDTDLVGTFIGRNIDKSIRENFDEFEEVFGKIVEYAEKNNVRLMIENCDMKGWQIPGLPGTISFSPELWAEMFRRIPSKNFGLNYDPSHLVLMLMDYLGPISEFKDRIFHVHAKDGKILPDKLKYYGVYDMQLEPKWGYKAAKMPGLGDVDWKAFIGELKKNGYDGVISIEHEDNDYEGSLEKVKEGLLIAGRHLRPVIDQA